MTTTEINYDKVFQMFTSDDDLRKNFNHPFRQDGRYYATDAHSLIFMPVTDANLPYAEQDAPNAKAVIPVERTMSIEINIDELDGRLEPEFIDEEIMEEVEKECSECDGEKDHECSCGDVHECTNCGGTGKETDEVLKKTGRQIPDDNANYLMFDVFYKYKQLRRLVDACKLLGCETITKVFGGKTNGNLFICGKVTILVMPVVNYNADEVDYAILKHTIVF